LILPYIAPKNVGRTLLSDAFGVEVEIGVEVGVGVGVEVRLVLK
jgi:hypothetical protein